MMVSSKNTGPFPVERLPKSASPPMAPDTVLSPLASSTLELMPVSRAMLVSTSDKERSVRSSHSATAGVARYHFL